MPLHLFNTLSEKVEPFAPSEDQLVRMYACGPTVYDYGHIGNFRTFVAVDILRRFLRQSRYRLKHVMNITDVDDRIIENSARAGQSVREYTEKYTQAFLEDAAILGIQTPEYIVRATDHVPAMAHFIRELEEQGIAYRTQDGSYYFRITRFPEYGKLSKKDFSGIIEGARVDSDRFDKEEARDFALWKAPKPGEAFWETEIGPGRPGWHIECSVMSMEYLGESFDLHAGGEDLMFPHHENEIAQSEALTHKTFARCWMHVRFLLVEGEKMSKSLGNFYTLRDLMLKGYKPSAIRYLLTEVPYRKQLNFTFDGLTQATKSVERLRNFRRRMQSERFPEGCNDAVAALAQRAVEGLRTGLEDDLNTAAALGAIFDMVREANAAADGGQVRQKDAELLLGALVKFDEIFDVMTDTDAGKMSRIVAWAEGEGREVQPAARELAQAAGLPEAEIERLVGEMQAARKGRDFARSDGIRKQLNDAGIIVETTKEGVRWKRK